MDHPNKTVFVTGVSSGIGWGAVKVLSGKGWRVFGSVRKAEDGERLKAEFGEAFTPVVFDVTDEAAVRAGADQVRALLGGRKLGGLVNNAGVALGGPAIYMDVDVFRKQLEVNLVGVLIATQAFAPLLGADPALEGPPGRIVNIGSVGGRSAFPFMLPYHTSKFGLEGFTDSLRRELMIFGIDATLVAPGSVATRIWGKAEQEDWSHYDDTAYRGPLKRMMGAIKGTAAKGVAPERIGEAIATQLSSANPKTYVRITSEPLRFLATTRLPARMVDRIVARQLGLTRET
ncbi:MAG: SDR family NAD(P)-dependent oxidoreductase [Hyphomonadaceae bacterium]